MTLSQSKKVVDKFQQKYPFIKAELFRGGGDEVLNRILNEARGGLYAWDVVSTRGDSVLTLMDAKLITSYRSPESKIRSNMTWSMTRDIGPPITSIRMCSATTPIWSRKMTFPKPTNSFWILSGKEKRFPSTTQPMGFLRDSSRLG